MWQKGNAVVKLRCVLCRRWAPTAPSHEGPRRRHVPLAVLALLLASSGARATSGTIVPGGIWRDTAGHIIEAHGAGLLFVNGWYYWFGEDHAGAGTDASFRNIRCYRSRTLRRWTFVRNVLTRRARGELGPGRVVERPKVLFNLRTRRFVLYVHIDDLEYREAKVGVATSRHVCGPYTYHGSRRPLGHESRDLTLFRDADGAGYLISEDRRASGLRIYRLTANYRHVQAAVALPQPNHEAPALVKQDGRYVLVGSQLTGWAPNANAYATAPTLAGPWSPFRPLAPCSSNTFASQIAFLLPIMGPQARFVLYLGDRWIGSALGESRYVWLPLDHRGSGHAELVRCLDTRRPSGDVDTRGARCRPCTPG